MPSSSRAQSCLLFWRSELQDWHSELQTASGVHMPSPMKTRTRCRARSPYVPSLTRSSTLRFRWLPCGSREPPTSYKEETVPLSNRAQSCRGPFPRLLLWHSELEDLAFGTVKCSRCSDAFSDENDDQLQSFIAVRSTAGSNFAKTSTARRTTGLDSRQLWLNSL